MYLKIMFVCTCILVSMEMTTANVRKLKCLVARMTILLVCWQMQRTTWSEGSATWLEKELAVSRLNSVPAAGFNSNRMACVLFHVGLIIDIHDPVAICWLPALFICMTNRLNPSFPRHCVNSRTVITPSERKIVPSFHSVISIVVRVNLSRLNFPGAPPQQKLW